jgi:hypothetical protein
MGRQAGEPITKTIYYFLPDKEFTLKGRQDLLWRRRAQKIGTPKQ